MKPYIIPGGVSVDTRGHVTFNNDFDMSPIKRFYMLENFKYMFVRAWHGHVKEEKWAICISGRALVAAVAMFQISNLDKYTIEEYTGATPYRFELEPNGDVLYIPPGYANGHQNLAEGTRLIHFSNLTLEESEGDDYRFSPETHGWVWE